jgi:hypothetical protein
MPAAEADAAIRSVLTQQQLLHPAFSSPDGQYQACKRLSEAVLVHIVPPDDWACPMMRAMLRELFATCLLRSTLASLAPYSINKVRKKACTAEQAAPGHARLRCFHWAAHPQLPIDQYVIITSARHWHYGCCWLLFVS